MMGRSSVVPWVVSLGLILTADAAGQPVALDPLPDRPPEQSLPRPVPRQPLIQPQQQPALFPAFLPLVFMPACLLPLLLVYLHQHRVRHEQNAEEEDKTKYTEEDLMEDWEFKIIRNPYNQFDRREYLEKILQEEAKAGWQLVEKFDGMRVRLKRPVSQRAGDANLPPDYDAYRTVVRPKINIPRDIAMMFCLMLFLLCAAFVALAPLMQSNDPIPPEAFRVLMWASGAGVLPFGTIALFLILRTLRERRQA